MVELSFDKGTILLRGNPPDQLVHQLDSLRFDKRTRNYRSPAHNYRDIVLQLKQQNIPYEDLAREFSPIEYPWKAGVVLRDYQQKAVDSWVDAGMKGVVSLPTGAGKTILALAMIQTARRPALVHVPTIDLMHQWHEVLTKHFNCDVGLWGGGYNETGPITVATYDSALLHVTHRGNLFGLQVFDECHHLPGRQFRYTAISSIAPFRVGLTATPERSDGGEDLLYSLCGPICFEAKIQTLKGSTLAPYKVETLRLELNESERLEYDRCRSKYLDFLRQNDIKVGTPAGWRKFLWRTSLNKEGREAFQAYLRQKKLSQAATAKLETVWKLINEHARDRILIFTQDNEMAYRIGTAYLLPVLTHHTRVKERESMLKSFRNGEYPVLVTSKVLNEGVDVPEANVAIIVSGSASVREHVQRLGRILRARPGKEALLYELISHNTGEQSVNKRRRRHSAYKGGA